MPNGLVYCRARQKNKCLRIIAQLPYLRFLMSANAADVGGDGSPIALAL
jgi:hypothetical protein